MLGLICDNQVRNAMNEINAAKRNKQAAAEKAEADKILLVKAAEAEAESKYLSGVGVARQRKVGILECQRIYCILRHFHFQPRLLWMVSKTACWTSQAA